MHYRRKYEMCTCLSHSFSKSFLRCVAQALIVTTQGGSYLLRCVLSFHYWKGKHTCLAVLRMHPSCCFLLKCHLLWSIVCKGMGLWKNFHIVAFSMKQITLKRRFPFSIVCSTFSLDLRECVTQWLHRSPGEQTQPCCRLARLTQDDFIKLVPILAGARLQRITAPHTATTHPDTDVTLFLRCHHMRFPGDGEEVQTLFSHLQPHSSAHAVLCLQWKVSWGVFPIYR